VAVPVGGRGRRRLLLRDRVTGTLSALALGAIPIDRTRVNRRSADLAASLLDEGWSLLIFPEGGRSPDGWGQPFRGGAAFLSIRCGVPVVPVHLDGTGSILGRGATWPKPGRTKVTFGAPLRPAEGDDARRFGDRIEQAVAVLGDEAISDWWSARRRAANGRHAGADRAGLPGVAPGVGAVGVPESGEGGPAPAPEAHLAVTLAAPLLERRRAPRSHNRSRPPAAACGGRRRPIHPRSSGFRVGSA
jgi:hypothetical protein